MAFVAIVLPAALLAGCSNSGDDASTLPSGNVAAGDPTAQAAAAYEGLVGQPPTDAVKPSADGLAWVVSCGQTVPTCSTPANAAVTAAQALGWEGKLCDGKLNPQGWSACIRQGISAKASGIVFIGQDCGAVQAALTEAAQAKIPVIGAGGNDCDVTGGTKQFASTVQNLPDLTSQQWWEKIGALQADWIIGATGGKAQVLSLQFTDSLWGSWIQDGFAAELATCPGCEVLDVLEVGNADVAAGELTQKFSTALLKQPTANAVNVPIDGWFLAGLGQAVQSSGRSEDLSVIGAIGDVGNFDLIGKGGGEDASVAFNSSWTGWAGIDTLLRVQAGQDVLPAGIGLQVVDADHNLPAAGQPFVYTPAIDFTAAYKKAWGLA
ncbi:sugar ABC transporter substrate-binding protein [Actinocorallia herbida]|nr:substrate-binding domain-containing protein [Actinocorallia herbida]